MKHVGAGLAPTHKKSNRVSDIWVSLQQHMRIRLIKTRCIALLAFLALLPPSASLILPAQSVVHAAGQVNKACIWYIVLPGDTLNTIARRHQTTSSHLVSLNHISNANRIFAGRPLCIANKTGSGLPPNGTRCSSASHALEWSSSNRVTGLLRQAATLHGLPANLLLAIAWQESNWQQHVIACDGGIGTMQLMPQTALVLNTQTHAHYDPYKLADNITLGAIYLHFLWLEFHGDLIKVISAYNEGNENVMRYGIFNRRYVNNVLALMHRF